MSTGQAMRAVERMQAQLERMEEQGAWIDRLLGQLDALPSRQPSERSLRDRLATRRCCLRETLDASERVQ